MVYIGPCNRTEGACLAGAGVGSVPMLLEDDLGPRARPKGKNFEQPNPPSRGTVRLTSYAVGNYR